MIEYVTRIMASNDYEAFQFVRKHGFLWEVKLKGEFAFTLTPDEMEKALVEAMRKKGQESRRPDLKPCSKCVSRRGGNVCHYCRPGEWSRFVKAEGFS